VLTNLSAYRLAVVGVGGRFSLLTAGPIDLTPEADIRRQATRRRVLHPPE
jgi:hypothetical protein